MGLSSNLPISVNELYEKIHPYDIFKHYCTNWLHVNYEINKNFLADPDLRPGDHDPSARITISERGTMYYIDYAENEPLKAADFVAKKFNLHLADAVNKIYNELNSDNKSSIKLTPNKEIKKVVNSNKHSAKVIKIKSRDWTEKDLNYWKQFGWSKELLVKANICPISKFWVNGRKYIVTTPAYSFNYYFHEDIFRRKIYFPFKTYNRFVSNIDNTVVQGWHMLPKEGGDLLVITKAFKDVGTFYNAGVYSCATNNETSFFPEPVVNKLKSRWKNIFLWWDNDKEGIKSGDKYADKYNLTFVHTPENSSKDPSDFFKDFGRESFIKLLKTKIYEKL